MVAPIVVAIIDVVGKGLDLTHDILARKQPTKAKMLEEFRFDRLQIIGRIDAEKRRNPTDQNDALIEQLMREENEINQKIAILQDSARTELALLLNAK